MKKATRKSAINKRAAKKKSAKKKDTRPIRPPKSLVNTAVRLPIYVVEWFNEHGEVEYGSGGRSALMRTVLEKHVQHESLIEGNS